MTDYRAILAAPDDVDAVHALLSAAGDRLAARGFPNWLPPYPRERVAEKVSDRIVWMVRDASTNEPVATYTLRPLSIHPYNGVEWADPSAIARYLNRLAVHPAHQGRGVGRWCLQRVAEQCALDGAAAVRCDVLQANIPLRRFYERNGYLLRGDRFHSGWRFSVYEQVLGR
ncbi:MAG: GNAT family N-acetyltransferase [Gemmatimonadetes bacterium]|nr:GNAT family N-acetyltransferase [Gemmatimonadota bacterium]